jgi:DNA-binding beta-propeller fold protein YncE
MSSRKCLIALLGVVLALTFLGEASEASVTVRAFIPGIVQPNNYSSVAGIALSPDESRLYTAQWSNTSSDPIGVYSTASNTLIDQMSYGCCHGDVVVSKDGRYVYTASYYNGDVSRFDTANGNARTALGVGSWATDLWITPDGNRVLAHYDQPHPSTNSSMALLNVEGGAFANIGYVPLEHPGLGDWASGPVAFSADSKHAYIPTARSSGEGAVLLDLDLDSLTITRSLVFSGDRLTGAVRSGDTLYVASEDQKKVFAVDLSTFSLLPGAIDLPYAPDMIALDPDGKHLFLLHPSDDRISVVDLDSKSVVGGLSGLSSPSDIEFTANGRTAYVAQMYGCGGPALGGVSVLDVDFGAAPVPEPTALLVWAGLLAIGGVAAAMRRRRPTSWCSTSPPTTSTSGLGTRWRPP